MAPYPDATITQTVQVPGNLMVGMESGDNLDPIFEFYEKQLAADRWKISA